MAYHPQPRIHLSKHKYISTKVAHTRQINQAYQSIQALSTLKLQAFMCRDLCFLKTTKEWYIWNKEYTIQIGSIK